MGDSLITSGQTAAPAVSFKMRCPKAIIDTSPLRVYDRAHSGVKRRGSPALLDLHGREEREQQETGQGFAGQLQVFVTR